MTVLRKESLKLFVFRSKGGYHKCYGIVTENIDNALLEIKDFDYSGEYELVEAFDLEGKHVKGVRIFLDRRV